MNMLSLHVYTRTELNYQWVVVYGSTGSVVNSALSEYTGCSFWVKMGLQSNEYNEQENRHEQN